jgi:dsDNA-specific endonuclease/ATPase MutS2
MENDPVKIPITDELDLHLFQPRDYPDLLQDYLEECLKAGIVEVRIIHGKGTGFQRRRVREILTGLSMVASFEDAPPQSGGWGATVAILKSALGR